MPRLSDVVVHRPAADCLSVNLLEHIQCRAPLRFRLHRCFSSPYDSSCPTPTLPARPALPSRAADRCRSSLPSAHFSLFGSRSRTALPSHPSVATLSGSHVCQMSIERKCDRFGFGYPTPATIAMSPASHIGLIAPKMRMEAEVVVYRQHPVLWHIHRPPEVVVQRIAVRHDRVHEIIPAAQLQHNQNRILTLASPCFRPPYSCPFPLDGGRLGWG